MHGEVMLKEIMKMKTELASVGGIRTRRGSVGCKSMIVACSRDVGRFPAGGNDVLTARTALT